MCSVTSPSSLKRAREVAANAAREELAHWMMDNGFATGHGDSLSDLLSELTWQIKELRTESK